MLLAKTTVPWASRWLYYYELWLVTGKWLGGGIAHSTNDKDIGVTPKNRIINRERLSG